MAIGKCLSDQCSIAKLTKGNFLMIEKWLETDLGKTFAGIRKHIDSNGNGII